MRRAGMRVLHQNLLALHARDDEVFTTGIHCNSGQGRLLQPGRIDAAVFGLEAKLLKCPK
ncbi:hypothetical protein D3C78_1702320 [compost metagenome]